MPAVSDLRQQEPVEGAAATEKTEFWVFFDRDRLYVSVRCWESDMPGLVANEMRRDNNNIFQGDHVAFLLDTFYDQRNGVEFAINPIGGRWDGQISNESQINADWNPVYDLAVGRFDGGWSVEVAIPFKSLRYGPGRAQIVGHERAARQPGQERDVVPHHACRARSGSAACSTPRSRPRSSASRCRPAPVSSR